jgi:lysophospholipase L1-like esterase
VISTLVEKLGVVALALVLGWTPASAAVTSLDFADFDRRSTAGDHLNVVFFGGSLTWGAMATNPELTSYRAVMGDKFEQAYPKAHFTFWDAAIGGTGSELGAFRLERDVLSHKPDLVFLDFTVNDGGVSADKLASYESLVRRMVQAGVPVVEVILPVKATVMPGAVSRAIDARHKEIAQAYGVPVADVVTWARQEISAGKTTPDALWDWPGQQIHPGDAGYALYADAAWQAYQDAVRNGAVCHVPEKMVNADTYMHVNRAMLAALAPLPAGWTTGMPHRSAISFDFTPSRWLGNEAVAALPAAGGAPPAPLHLKVRARDLFLFGEATPTGGKYFVRIDGKESKPYSTNNKQGNMRYIETLALGLDPSVEHLVDIVPQLAPGEELRLESLCVAGGDATVTGG